MLTRCQALCPVSSNDTNTLEANAHIPAGNPAPAAPGDAEGGAAESRCRKAGFGESIAAAILGQAVGTAPRGTAGCPLQRAVPCCRAQPCSFLQYTRICPLGCRQVLAGMSAHAAHMAAEPELPPWRAAAQEQPWTSKPLPHSRVLLLSRSTQTLQSVPYPLSSTCRKPEQVGMI